MGKKSLIKSTSKKKTTAKKKKEDDVKKTAKPKTSPAKKQAAKKPAAKKKAPAKKTAAASTDKKKKAPAKKTAAKKKAPAKTAKKAAPKKKKLTVKELVFKTFETASPKTLYTVPEDKRHAPTFSSAELLDGYNSEDANRIRALLKNTYSMKDLEVAAEKAAAEKAAAEKAAAEKAAAEKAAAEKAAAEKAAAEKAAAEKAAAEKAAAEKAAAEKAAAEKAAAEKAAAEKAAAEKAAAEKLEAARKAADKAEAERKKAAEKEPKVTVAYDQVEAKPAKEKKESDPVDNTIKIFAACLAFIILLIIGGSMSNSGNYYLTENKGALEIWKGKFAPLGEKLLVTLPGVEAPLLKKEVYSKKELFPIAFTFFIDKADALLQVPGIPDFEGIKATLATALEFSTTNEMRETAYARVDNIDRHILLYKAEVAASRGTIEDLEAAIGFLNEADALTTDEIQEKMIGQNIQMLEKEITRLEAAAVLEAEALEKEAEAAEMAAEVSEGEEAEAAVPETSEHK